MPFIVKSRLGIFLWGGWETTKLEFSPFKESLLAQSQESTFVSSSSIIACKKDKLLCLLNKLVSSANKWKSKKSEQENHLYIAKRVLGQEPILEGHHKKYSQV